MITWSAGAVVPSSCEQHKRSSAYADNSVDTLSVQESTISSISLDLELSVLSSVTRLYSIVQSPSGSKVSATCDFPCPERDGAGRNTAGCLLESNVRNAVLRKELSHTLV